MRHDGRLIWNVYQISYYQSKGVWWNETDKGLEFYDTDEYFVDHDILPPSHPKAHHFRSSNFKQEEEYLQNTWKLKLLLDFQNTVNYYAPVNEDLSPKVPDCVLFMTKIVLSPYL